MRSKEDYHLEKPTWCLGCGLYGVFEALKRAAFSLALDPEEMVIVSGIGCHGRLNNYFRAYGFHGLHGRVLPVATAVKMVNPRLFVIGISGDGDAYSIGLSHFIHSARRNIGIFYIVVDNRVFALTEGQTSPTSDMGFISPSTPYGSKEQALDGAELALASGATFVARGFSGNVAHLKNLIEQGLEHRGFSLLEVLSPCITHNKINTYEWFRRHIDFLEGDKEYNPADKKQARERLKRGDKIPVGLIFREEKPCFEELVLPDKENPIALADLSSDYAEIEKILEKFR